MGYGLTDFIWTHTKDMTDKAGKMELKTIAHIHTDFPQKFGLPRQSGLIDDLTGYIVFEKEYRNPEALRGLEGYDYLWILW